MLVVCVRHMPVCVLERRMFVPMRMWFANRIMRFMPVLMVLVMAVGMLM